MSNKIDDLLNEAKNIGAELWDSVKGAGKSKLDDTVRNLNESLPDIESAGFKLVRLDVDIALLPRLFTRFRQVEIISDEARKDILLKTKDRRFLNLMLKGLYKAAEVRPQIQIDGMDMTEIELEIGLTPSAKLIFRENRKSITPPDSNSSSVADMLS